MKPACQFVEVFHTYYANNIFHRTLIRSKFESFAQKITRFNLIIITKTLTLFRLFLAMWPINSCFCVYNLKKVKIDAYWL